MQSYRRPAWITIVRMTLLLLVIATVLLTATELLACPTCKDGLAESDPVSQAQARGFFYSILFMMAMPFVIIGTFGGAAYWSIRKARESQVDQTESESRR